MKTLVVLILAVVLGVGIYHSCRVKESLVQGVFQGGGESPGLEQARLAVGLPQIIRGQDRYSAGTGSLVSHGGRNLILVAFHIFIKRGEDNPSEQARVDRVRELKLVDASKEVIASAGRPLKMPRLALASPDDARADFVFFEVLDDPPPRSALPLATSVPLEGAPIWLVGRQGTAAGRVDLSSDRRLVITLSDPAPAGRLIGAPVINHLGEVVGCIALKGRSNALIAVPLKPLLAAVRDAP